MLKQIKNEINRIPISNALVITRGVQSFKTTISTFNEKDNPLIKGGSIKVLPFQFAKYYLKISTDHIPNHEAFLQELGIKPLNDFSNKNVFETNINFDYLVNFENEEMYYVDLLDNDLMKLRMLKEYRHERYKRDGRRVLVLTSNADFHRELHREFLDVLHHVHLLPLNLNKCYFVRQELSEQKCY